MKAQIWLVQAIGGVLSAIIFILLYFFLLKTQTGISARAVADDPVAAALSGVNVDRVYNLTSFLIFGIAAFPSVFVAMMYSLLPAYAGEYTFLAFVICVFGGLGNIIGSLLGGVVIGTLQILLSYFIGPWTRAISMYIIYLLVLSIKPTGLLGSRRA